SQAVVDRISSSTLHPLNGRASRARSRKIATQAISRRKLSFVDPAAPPSPRPVVLVHGIWNSRAAFARISRYLRARGFDVHALDLVPSDGSVAVEQLAAQLASYVDAGLPAAAPFDLVGFSMGGVVSRYYVQRLGGASRVQRLVTISSPHHGTATAYLSN